MRKYITIEFRTVLHFSGFYDKIITKVQCFALRQRRFFMGWFKSQMWKVIDWKDDGNDTMVYRFQMPSDKYEIMSGSKLTVRESQVAVFVHKGKIADIFQPGQYTLSTNNLPVLSGLRALLYQGRDVVVKSDVYFVNTKQFTNLKWGAKNPITMRDADFGMVRVGAFGTYSMRVFDAERFLKELFGTNSTFTVADINDHLKSLLVSQMADTVAESKIPMLDMAANLQEFSAMCRTNITEKFREYGLDITSFTIENISLPQEVERCWTRERASAYSATKWAPTRRKRPPMRWETRRATRVPWARLWAWAWAEPSATR